jgi:hypothetical protein
MSLDWPTDWDQGAWAAVLSGLAFVAAGVGAVLAGGARRAAREQRTGFRRARLLRALDDCRAAVDDARRAIERDRGLAGAADVLAEWNTVVGEIGANQYDGSGMDVHDAERLHHALDAVGRERSLLLVWLDVGAEADSDPLRAALQDAARQLGDVRTEIERRADR